jgi:hypothetical protein
MAHDEQLGVTALHRFSEKLQSSLVEPSRSGFQIVWEGKPQAREFLDLFIVRLAQIYYVGYTEGL